MTKLERSEKIAEVRDITVVVYHCDLWAVGDHNGRDAGFWVCTKDKTYKIKNKEQKEIIISKINNKENCYYYKNKKQFELDLDRGFTSIEDTGYLRYT